MLSGVWDVRKKTTKIFVNGNVVGSANLPTNLFPAHGTAIIGDGFSGLLDSARIIKWPLSTAAISKIANQNRPPDRPHNPFPPDKAKNQLTAHYFSWDCDDPDGDLIHYSLCSQN